MNKTIKQWKPGDKVKLVSGGPEMTVERQTVFFGQTVQQTLCQWFDKNNTLVWKIFTRLFG